MRVQTPAVLVLAGAILAGCGGGAGATAAMLLHNRWLAELLHRIRLRS